MTQPDDPGYWPDETTRHWSTDEHWQDRLLLRVLACVALALFILLALTFTVDAQILGGSRVCDVYVNGIRVTWPTHSLSLAECQQALEEIKSYDATEAVIECRCQSGGKT